MRTLASFQPEIAKDALPRLPAWLEDTAPAVRWNAARLARTLGNLAFTSEVLAGLRALIDDSRMVFENRMQYRFANPDTVRMRRLKPWALWEKARSNLLPLRCSILCWNLISTPLSLQPGRHLPWVRKPAGGCSGCWWRWLGRLQRRFTASRMDEAGSVRYREIGFQVLRSLVIALGRCQPKVVFRSLYILG
jgi:hypothetical protein